MQLETLTGRLVRPNRAFAPLLVVLIVVLVAAPLLEQWRWASVLLLVLLFVTCAFTILHHPVLQRVVAGAALVVLGLHWLAHGVAGMENRTLLILSDLAIAAFMLFLSGLTVATILCQTQITRDTIAGAVCGYLLISYAFAFGYVVLEGITPGAFIYDTGAFALKAGATVQRGISKLLYFSFVTLSTTGYGDVLPASPVARSLAMLEMLAGPLYLAAFVARLVGVMGAGNAGPRGLRKESSDEVGP